VRQLELNVGRKFGIKIVATISAALLFSFLHHPAGVGLAQVEAYFVMEVQPRQDKFIIKLTDPAKIQRAREILSGQQTPATRVKGRIIKEAAPWNPPWSFHLDPASIEFFSLEAEVCDASLGYVESFLSEAGGAFLPNSIWCPWSSRLINEISRPDPLSGVTSVSAASFGRAGLAPAAIVAAYGVNLANTTEMIESPPLPLMLGGTTLKIKDALGVERLAPLFFVSPTQVNYLVPAGAASGIATITITNASGASATEWTQILNIAPGLFTANSDGRGAPAALVVRLRADGSQRFEPLARFDAEQNRFVPLPIDLGPAGEQVFLMLFGTGLRRQGVAAPQAKIAGVSAEVLFIGEVSGFFGLDQVNLRISRELVGRGDADVDLLVDDHRTNPVVVKIK
jgi:uncharacterized protein (TIGR03437 family)